MPANELHESFIRRYGSLCVSRCCKDKLFCHVFAPNMCFRGGPGCPDLEPISTDVELVDRVANGLKPLASVVLDGKSDHDRDFLEERLLSSALCFWPYLNQRGVNMVGVCADVSVAELVDVANLATLYSHVGRPDVAADVEASATLRISSLLDGSGPGTDPLLKLEDERRFWLLGLVYGYPIWSTVAFLQHPPARGRDESEGRAACEADEDHVAKRRRQEDAARLQAARLVACAGGDGVALPVLKAALSKMVEHKAEVEEFPLTCRYGTLLESGGPHQRTRSAAPAQVPRVQRKRGQAVD